MASNRRQSVFGGFLGLSLNLVIFSFFMWLCPSGGYDAQDRSSYYRVSNEENPAFDHANCIETHLVGGIQIVELDYMRVQEHPRGRSKVDAVLFPVGEFLHSVPFEFHRGSRPHIY